MSARTPAGPLHGDGAPRRARPAAPPADLNALDARRLAAVGRAGVDGELHLGGVDGHRAGRASTAPRLFVLDEADFRGRCRGLRRRLRAAPTSTTPARRSSAAQVARWVAEEGLHLDVCTGGELAVALPPASPPSGSRCTATTSRSSSSRAAVDAGRRPRSCVDSFDEIDRLAAGRARVGRRAPAGAGPGRPSASRRTPTSSSRPRTRTRSSASRWPAATRSTRGGAGHPRSRRCELAGLHCHIGSQIFDTAGFEVAAHRVVGLLAPDPRRARRRAAASSTSAAASASPTLTDDDPADPADVATTAARDRRARVRGARPAGAAAGGRARPGDRRAGHASPSTRSAPSSRSARRRARSRTYVSRRRRHERQHPHRPLRRRLHRARSPAARSRRRAVLCRVVGKHCESGDIVVRDVWLPADVAPGDLLAVAATGAYCRSMASNYNHRAAPAGGRGPGRAAPGSSGADAVRRVALDAVLADVTAPSAHRPEQPSERRRE